MLWWTQPFAAYHGVCERPEPVRRRLSLYWRYAPRCTLRKLFHPGGNVRCAVFSPNGCLLATASEDGNARVWNIATGQPVTPVLKRAAPVLHVAFSPDGRQLASSSWGAGVYLWDLSPGKCTHHLYDNQYVEGVAYSPSGQQFIAAPPQLPSVPQ